MGGNTRRLVVTVEYIVELITFTHTIVCKDTQHVSKSRGHDISRGGDGWLVGVSGREGVMRGVSGQGGGVARRVMAHLPSSLTGEL
ncbi:hypothetical protein E2C01_078907 [Portunus trituberculatus]|uniref:Uncharacterized protein n=1 Tax=Portunus trituberculatus TaxID=210409 RepID=A0A5B7IPZ3_PORTR|nr:hypothetical protein [Portunus trituberculatus]